MPRCMLQPSMLIQMFWNEKNNNVILLKCATANFLRTSRGIRTHTRISMWCVCVCAASHLVIFVPGQRLCGEHKPVLLRSPLHDPDVVDGQPAFPDHLGDAQTHHNDITAPKKNQKNATFASLWMLHTHSFMQQHRKKYTLTGSREATQGHSSRSF